MQIAVCLWRLQSDCGDCHLEWVEWEISERKANVLNFSNPVLSTNQRPQFWALNQSQQSDSHLSDQTAISAIRLQSSYIAVWLWRLQSDCGDCSLIAEIAEIQQHTYTCPNTPFGLRHVARCFILIVEIALWLLRRQSNCGYCTLITEIAKIWQSSCIWSHANCGHCHSRHCYCHCSHCVAYTCPTPPHGLRHVARCFILIAEIGLWLLRLQSNCGDCTLITEIAITIGVI